MCQSKKYGPQLPTSISIFQTEFTVCVRTHKDRILKYIFDVSKAYNAFCSPHPHKYYFGVYLNVLNLYAKGL